MTIDTSPAALRKIAEIHEAQGANWNASLFRTIAAEKEAQQCSCKDRAATACPGQFEPGCDLGNNEKHVRVHPPEQHLNIVAPEELARLREIARTVNQGEFNGWPPEILRRLASLSLAQLGYEDAPPKKPAPVLLTRDEIDTLWQNVKFNQPDSLFRLDIARAIESAVLRKNGWVE